jgi:hypothetical protein
MPINSSVACSGPSDRRSVPIASGYDGGRWALRASAMCRPRSRSSNASRPRHASFVKERTGKPGCTRAISRARRRTSSHEKNVFSGSATRFQARILAHSRRAVKALWHDVRLLFRGCWKTTAPSPERPSRAASSRAPPPATQGSSVTVSELPKATKEIARLHLHR